MIPNLSEFILLWALIGWHSFGIGVAYAQPLRVADSDQFERSDDLRLIEGLRIRRLFDLAELHCRRLLAAPDLESTDLVGFTIELIKTQTAEAILSSSPQRESNWKLASQTATDFFVEHPRHPRELLVQVQQALSHLSHGQLLRQELEAEMAPESVRETALAELRQSNSMLSEIQRQIVKLVPEQRGRTLAAGELTSEELMALNNNVRYQLAITNANRAQLYAADDRLNRIDALGEVLARLEEVLRESSVGQPLWWETQILQIECLRLLGKVDEAEAVISKLEGGLSEQEDSLDSTSAPQSLVEQQLRLSLVTHDSEAAMGYLQAAEGIPDRVPSLDLARLEVALDFTARAEGKEKTDWLNRAAQLARRIESQHGSYWGRRANLVLIGTSGVAAGDPNLMNPKMSAGTSSAELDLLVGLADQAMRNERFDDAVKAYDRAVETASQLGDLGQSFALSVQACKALEQQNQHAAAAERLVRLANQNASYELASAAHLRGCWNFAQDIASEEQRQKFVVMLTEHLAKWPSAESAAQVRIWLGGQQQTAQQWQSAFETYVSVAPTSPSYRDAMTRAAYCATRWIEGLPPNQQKTSAVEVTRRIQTITQGATNQKKMTGPASLAAAEVAIRFDALNFQELIEPLKSAIASSTDAREQNLARAWLFSIYAFDTTQSNEAEKLLDDIADDKSLLAIAELGLNSIAKHEATFVSAESQQWRLKVVELALSQTLTAGETTAWLYRKSDALADLQQPAAALEVLRGLEKQFPTNAGIQLRIARLMTRIDETNDPERPLAVWRRLASQLKPHSDAWYEAKYHVALLLEKSGQRDDAKKMLLYLKTIPPGWEQSDWKDRFERLLQRCQ